MTIFASAYLAVHAAIRVLAVAFALDAIPKPGTVAHMSEPISLKGYRSADKNIHGKD
jgi:hypothetical protein